MCMAEPVDDACNDDEGESAGGSGGHIGQECCDGVNRFVIVFVYGEQRSIWSSSGAWMSLSMRGRYFRLNCRLRCVVGGRYFATSSNFAK